MAGTGATATIVVTICDRDPDDRCASIASGVARQLLCRSSPLPAACPGCGAAGSAHGKASSGGGRGWGTVVAGSGLPGRDGLRACDQRGERARPAVAAGSGSTQGNFTITVGGTAPGLAHTVSLNLTVGIKQREVSSKSSPQYGEGATFAQPGLHQAAIPDEYRVIAFVGFFRQRAGGRVVGAWP